MRYPSRIIAAACLLASALAGCVATDQHAVAPGDLPPIRSDYRDAILAWARGFYADPHSLRDTAISNPIPFRDDTGRLLWLVCVEATARGRGGNPLGMQRQAFGFAPNYVSAPLERNYAALTREECDDPRLSYKPFPALSRL